MSDDLAVLLLHGHAGEVSHMLFGAGQLVEQRRFAAVLVPHQGKCQLHISGQRFSLFFRLPVFSGEETSSLCSALRLRIILVRRHDSDLLGVCQPQRQLVAVDLHLHRISAGRILDDYNLHAGDNAHIKKMLPQRTVSPD